MKNIRLFIVVCTILLIYTNVYAQDEDDLNDGSDIVVTIPEGLDLRLVTAITGATNSEGDAIGLFMYDGESLVRIAEDFVMPSWEGLFVTWSPDCEHIYFSADIAGTDESGMYEYNLIDGTATRYVEDRPFPLFASISPDNRWLTYIDFGSEERRFSIQRRDEEGSRDDFFLNTWGIVAWSADGNSALLDELNSGDVTIYELSLKGDNVELRTALELEDTFPFGLEMTADGEYFFIAHGDYNASDIYEYDLITGEITRITPDSQRIGNIALSPDESRIAYTNDETVLVINRDGTMNPNVIVYPSVAVVNVGPTLYWTNDGTGIVHQGYTELSYGLWDVFYIDLETRRPQRITAASTESDFINRWWTCMPPENAE